MNCTFTNTSDEDVFVSQFYCTIPAGESLGPIARTNIAIEADQDLKSLIADGTLTVAITPEDGDTVHVQNLDIDATIPLRTFNDGTRPLATAVPVGTIFFNTGDNFPNVSDGTNWRNPAGAVT